ncbi:hypothetical protein PC129_g13021 [Phytophthora cactorum]|uniref:Uncharacterized protein n=2 Tax=Phytophthora cactorum TaxID=29920 RepID=A0A329RSE1_9STRA|nr:hypothetical protein Pcac1_g24757 [Phytophthora cactorum]KAG2813452.1 hypothetical protein PC112_g14725 [Phytophthora cactorum]KAG2895079.1 hypothetical protein PC114_g15624 [Phytophthora cactorum]KAG2944809.1 hypothetical protein PC117_g8886 [Phytophthora cactorum]KAG3152398.1 hypothetical protein C6341_g16273 [Phytophthora cactorum]
MRSPEASLIRARAKAPLPDLLVLHLSNSDIECIKYLELCKNLQSLYADSNRIKDLEGIIELRKLWRIDLNGNLLKNLHALTSFRALGFLYLERNRICFEDLVCLRDQHLLELRLAGNDGLLKGNTIEEYRKKVVALLPNVWIFDTHFVSTAERQQAIEEFDEFVTSLLELPTRSASADLKFGSATDVWVESEVVKEDATPSASLIDIAHKRANPNESPDLRRLYAIVSFHNAECAVHNPYCHFSPSRQAPNSRLMPKIWLDEVLALTRRTQIEVIALFAVFLQFRFTKVLLSEALAIKQLDSPQFPSEAIRDVVNLPPYALVALISIVRQVSLEREQKMREQHQPEVESPDFKDESELLGAIPPLFTTLLGSTNPTGDSDPQATTIRCRRVIKMLSNVASFPDLEAVAFKGKGKREAIFRDLVPLIRAAESAPVSLATHNGRKVVVPSVAVSKHKAVSRSPKARSGLKMTWKRNAMPQDCENLYDSVDAVPSSLENVSASPQCVTKLDQVVAANSAAKRKPKPGDWVEVSSKQFVKIQFLSADGLFVVGAFPADTSRSITIALEQMYRVSSSVWRANYLTKHQALALSASSANNTRIGKLHRDSEAFHRHGAARNQGFPNHFVTAQMLEDMHRERNSSISSSSQTKTIEIFSTNDTLDANYVLTSPEHISAQNYCAVTSSLQQRRQPGGLWSPVRQCAPYSVLSSQAPSLTQSSSLNDLKMRKPRIQQQAANALQSPQSDDWLEIRRAMQAQLGIVVPSEGNDCRPLTSSSDSDLQTRTGVSSFLTTLPDSDASDSALATDPLQIDRPRLTTPPLTSSSSQKLVIGGGTKLESARVWHQVATKTEFVVAAPALGASHSAPLLPRQIRVATPKLKLMLPSISQKQK